MSKDGGPAFPLVSADRRDEHVGMSLRAYVATKALQGMLASEANPKLSACRKAAADHAGLDYTEQLALEAVTIADALLKALERS